MVNINNFFLIDEKISISDIFFVFRFQISDLIDQPFLKQNLLYQPLFFNRRFLSLRPLENLRFLNLRPYRVTPIGPYRATLNGT